MSSNDGKSIVIETNVKLPHRPSLVLFAQTREYTPAKARMLQQQHDAAQRRYLTAMKTLATVRKLLTPVRSPVEIASKLTGQRSGLRLRQAPVESGVPVAN